MNFSKKRDGTCYEINYKGLYKENELTMQKTILTNGVLIYRLNMILEKGIIYGYSQLTEIGSVYGLWKKV